MYRESRGKNNDATRYRKYGIGNDRFLDLMKAYQATRAMAMRNSRNKKASKLIGQRLLAYSDRKQ